MDRQTVGIGSDGGLRGRLGLALYAVLCGVFTRFLRVLFVH
jgi:hypothetical protein